MITFNFRKERSSLLGTIYRPMTLVLFQNKITGTFKPVSMIVDTGADYTLLPKFLALNLGINLSKDCRRLQTSGVGGNETVFFCKEKIYVRLGEWKRKIPLGFLDNDFIPPLFGRHQFFETFRTVFNHHQLTFSLP